MQPDPKALTGAASEVAGDGLCNLQGRHFTALDGFRGVAVLLVMLSHFIKTGEVIGDQQPWHLLLRGGFVGVDMFFVLSGFLITGILLDSPKCGARYFKTFYLRRFLRIFPLYYGVLLLAFVSFRHAGGDSPWWFVLFASNLGDAYYGRWLDVTDGVSLAHFWSLAVEEQFYLIWPLLVYLLQPRTLVKVSLALLVIAPLSGVMFFLANNGLGSYVFTLNRFHTLGMGALLAVALRHPTYWKACQAWALPISVVTGLLTTVGLMYAPRSGFCSAAPALWAPYLWGSVLVLSLRPAGLLPRCLSSRFLVFIGKISFGLYVYHSFFESWARQHIYEAWLVPALAGERGAALALFLPIAYGLSIALADLSWRWFEKPILGLNRKFQYR
ncbi:MAG: acyltransferase [Verrucomicrobiota bacterium]